MIYEAKNLPKLVLSHINLSYSIKENQEGILDLHIQNGYFEPDQKISIFLVQHIELQKTKEKLKIKNHLPTSILFQQKCKKKMYLLFILESDLDAGYDKVVYAHLEEKVKSHYKLV